MNQECQALIATIYPQDDLKAVVFSADKSAWNEDVNPMAGVIDNIKKFIEQSNQSLKDQINLNNDTMMKSV